jgi:hypothetical protein
VIRTGTGTGLKDTRSCGGCETHLGFCSPRRRRRRSVPSLVDLGLWRRGGPRPLAGGRVSIICLGFFQCLLRQDGEAAATSWSQNKVLPVLSSFRWCISRRRRAREVVCPMDFTWSGRVFRSLVWFQVSLFRSTVVIIGDGCCSSALVLWGLSTTTSHVSTTISSTTISFARLRWWRGEDGGAPSARASVCSRR